MAGDAVDASSQQIKTFASELEAMTKRNPLGYLGGRADRRSVHRHDDHAPQLTRCQRNSGDGRRGRSDPRFFENRN
jgi:hypothetical protein